MSNHHSDFAVFFIFLLRITTIIDREAINNTILYPGMGGGGGKSTSFHVSVFVLYAQVFPSVI